MQHNSMHFGMWCLKTRKNNNTRCKSCTKSVTYGPRIDEETDVFLECTISGMELRDHGGL